MSEEKETDRQHDIRKMFELDEREKEGAIYIAGVVLLIFSIILLAALTNVILEP